MKSSKYKVLALDGGGAKGVYTLGILAELEATLETDLGDFFDLVYGVSTGSIIATLIGLGIPISEIHDLYFSKVTWVLKSDFPSAFIKRNAFARSKKLGELARKIYQGRKFDAFQTQIGVVATRIDHSRPLIIKNSSSRAFSRESTFSDGFGLTIAAAVEASCSAVPFFRPKVLESDELSAIEAVDGGFSANNPSLYAMTDAIGALGNDPDNVALLSLGTGVFLPPKASFIKQFIRERELVRLFQLTLDTSSNSMELLTQFLFPSTSYLRVNDEFSDSKYAADLFETDVQQLERLEQLGRESFGKYEKDIRAIWAD